MFTRRQRRCWQPGSWQRRVYLALLVVAGLVVTGCLNIEADNGGFVMGSSIVVEKGEVAREDLVALGGSIRVDGRARRDVVVIGGSLTVNGTVGGDVVAVGGRLRLGPDAHVGGDATVVGGSLSRNPSAVIEGELVNVSFGYGLDHVFGGFSPLWWGGWWRFTPFVIFGRTTQLLYWLLLALLTVALVGDRVSSASYAVSRAPVRLGAIGIVGFLALAFAFLVLCVLSILLVGIPFLIALIFAWWLAYILGVVAVFQSIGGRVMRLVGRPEASQIAIVLAGGVVFGILRYFPVFGSLLWTVGALVGLGAVFATRFGSGRSWVPRRGSPMPPSAPPAG
ncbi:MAG: hypothetical protein ACE5HV_10440, partial [Acidobacteriota bacterium]